MQNQSATWQPHTLPHKFSVFIYILVGNPCIVKVCWSQALHKNYNFKLYWSQIETINTTRRLKKIYKKEIWCASN